MSIERSQQNGPPLRQSTRLQGEAGHIASSDFLAFAESLVRTANPGAHVMGASLHILSLGISTKVSGEAVCLSQSGSPVWRVSVADETGVTLAEITMTLASGSGVTPVIQMEPRRKPEVGDRRTLIALAAQDVFAEKGYAAATMREIAAAADMHVPTMYQYFRSKEEILELVYSWTISQAVDGMQDVLNTSGPAAERMNAVVRRLHEVNAELRRGTLVMNRETRSLSRAARDRVLSPYAEMIRKVGFVVADGQAEGAFRSMDPQMAAVFIDALADVWVLRPFAVGDVKPETYANELVAFVRGALTGEAAKTPENPGLTEINRRE
jgi:AcrR family transcriptional regulator